MYFFDPDRGRRRRALVRDQFVGTANSLQCFLDTACRDLENRVQGWKAEWESIFDTGIPDDRVLCERVRSKLGRYVSHPRAIEVTAEQGHVTLTGPILADEVPGLIAAVRSVRGVKSVSNQLEVHADRANIPALQGGGPRMGEPFEFMQSNWAPATRLVAGAIGTTLMLNCLVKRSFTSTALGLVGFGLLARASTNVPASQLVGRDSEQHPVRLRRTYHIEAPPERVFEFISNFENFSRFLNNVRDVQQVGVDRVRWTLVGPAGLSVQLEEQVTQRVANELLSWKSLPHSPICYSGTIHLRPSEEGCTQLDVEFAYHPPGGELGHFAASIFGADPETQMSKAIGRLKTQLEQPAGEPQRIEQAHEGGQMHNVGVENRSSGEV